MNIRIQQQYRKFAARNNKLILSCQTTHAIV